MDSPAPGEGQRFKRIPRQSCGRNLELDPLLNENLEQWPHLNELVQCYNADFVKDDCKYGRYESVAPPSFQNQIFEGPDTDIETELQLCNARHSKPEETTEDDMPSTSGRQIYETEPSASSSIKHCTLSPLPAYEPAFDWDNERSLIFGQRLPESLPATHSSGLKITVKVLSLSFQTGLVEPFSGTICLYNRDRREKLSEDFYFHILPTEMQDAHISLDRRGVFSLDTPSPSICLLIQLEKAATEEGGVTPSIYSRKEPVHLTEKEKQKLQVWSRVMPYREPFAWAMIPLFENNHAGGDAASPSSPLAPSMSGSSSQDSIVEPISKLTSDGKLNHYSSGSSVIVEISNLNKVKESYMEDSLQDPKRKVHKPVKGVLRLEVEKLHNDRNEADTISEGGSITNELHDAGELNNGRHSRNSIDGIHSSLNSSAIVKKDTHQNGQSSNAENGNNFQAFDFRMMARSEPFSQLFHCLYVYPLTVSLSRKRNLFVRVELRKDDSDIRKLPVEAVHPRDQNATLQKCAHTQISVGTRMSCYHDEVKISLPALLTPQHHLLFTFFHVDLQMKLEAPKPVIVGYAALPLSTHIQLLSDVSLPILRELVPHYLQESGKEKMDYLEDGKAVFRLRLRLCSSLFPVNERIRDFFVEYDRHTLHTSPPWGSELLEAINSLKNVESTALLQFLQPILNMLLHLIGDGGETLQVAAFRAMVNILTRVQQESSDGAERNKFLVNYVDFAFDDFGDRQTPVYPGLSTVWGSLARSKAKGYRVGPVYDDVLAMAWFFLELIVKSMGLEQSRLFYHNLPLGEDVPPLQLKEGVFRCIMQLFDCLLTEVHERCKKGLNLAKRLNSTLAFFCYDLLSIIEPRQVFELVSLYMDKFAGVCQSVLHDCKLTFLQIICDHDLFVEMPGRDPTDRNYLSSVLIQEIFLTLDHDDLSQRAKAARILVVLICKHEFDARYQKSEDKLYIAQLYFPLIGQILDEMPVFYNLNAIEKREVLVVILQIIRNLDDTTLIKAWQQSIARTRLFFKLLEECITHFEHNRTGDSLLLGSSSRSPDAERPASPKYSDRLSPSVNAYLSEASRHEIRPQGTPENGYMWNRISPQLSSPNQPYSLREALAQAQSSRIGSTARALRESLHPILRQKLELWEENLSTAVSLEVLGIIEKFSVAAASRSISTDYAKLDCVTSILMGLLSRSQPLTFWKAFLPVVYNIFSLHGATLMARENDRFLKQIAFHLLRLAVFRNDSVRKRAVVGLQILVRNSFNYFKSTTRLRVMLTITLSELLSDVQVTQMKSDGSLEESGEARRLRKSLEEMADVRSLSFATIIIGTIQYAVPAGIIHPGFIYEIFWVYVFFAVGVCFPMLMIWFNKPHDIKTFTPAWAFLIFPMMLVGVVAFNALKVIPVTDPRCIGVLLVGYVFQGLGFFMTFFYLAIYILRIMTTGFMEGHQANGAFVACGPPGFTALALINLGKQARIILPAYNLVSPQAGEIFFAASVMGALLLFGLALFFFFFGVLPYWFKLHKHLSEILGCWALTFPNVGWINTLRALGDIFGIKGFSVWHAIMTFLVCMIWLILFGLTILAFVRGKIFLAKDADVWKDTMGGDDAARNAASQVAPGLISGQSSVSNLPYTAPPRGDYVDIEKQQGPERPERPWVIDNNRI